jgi:hypothetical protein
MAFIGRRGEIDFIYTPIFYRIKIPKNKYIIIQSRCEHMINESIQKSKAPFGF